MGKMKLTSSETAILRELIFPEPFSHILSETGLPFGAIRDDLIKLVNHGYIEVYEETSPASPLAFYDSDHVDQFNYKATRLGLKRIQNHAI